MSSDLFGIWEADEAPVVLTLLDHGQAVGVHVRAQTPDGPVQQGGSVSLTGEGSLVRGLDGACFWMEANGARVERRVAGDVLTETVRQGDLQAVVTYRRSSAKQVLVYRRDLKMRKGKIAAQCAHGSMAVFFRRDAGRPGELSIPLDGPMEQWSRQGFAKIVLSVESEDDLLAIHEAALAAGLPSGIITDAGKTEFKGVPTRTVVAVGPAARGEIDRITGPGGLVACKLA